MVSAWELHRRWPEAEFHVVPDAGHSALEPGTVDRLVRGDRPLPHPALASGLPDPELDPDGRAVVVDTAADAPLHSRHARDTAPPMPHRRGSNQPS